MKPFHFKQFSIEQDQCAMKVSLDACVLGAYCNVANSDRILDIGTGTGLLSLMAAQRCNAVIDAVELDGQAAQQAKLNIENSPYSDRIHVHQLDINHFDSECLYDRIICNPPFFTEHLKGPNKLRNQARHNDSLSFHQLLVKTKQLLSPEGEAWFILPSHEHKDFIQIANTLELYIHKQLSLKSRDSKSPHREIFSLRHTINKTPLVETLLVHAEGNEYSDSFKQLLKPYYLKL